VYFLREWRYFVGFLCLGPLLRLVAPIELSEDYHNNKHSNYDIFDQLRSLQIVNFLLVVLPYDLSLFSLGGLLILQQTLKHVMRD
jgi:hypothetical protein